jgi:hypothetical protein
MKRIAPSLKDRIGYGARKLSVLNMFEIIVPVMPGDYYLLKDRYPIAAKLWHLNYVNPALVDCKEQFVSGSNILLGNSASYSNNHIEAIDNLANIDLQGRRVIIPLSYGDNNVAEIVKDYAIDKLGSNTCSPLLNFLPFHEYDNILRTCSIVIMNHLRQQAVGNVVQALLSGAHLYLQRKSTVYQFLRQNHFIVSEFVEGVSLRHLTTQQRETNRSLAIKIFGLERQRSRFSKLVQMSLKRDINTL